MIIDLDSHLREGYFLDEVFKLEPPFEDYTPVCIQEGEPHERRFKTKFERRRGSGKARSTQLWLQPQLRLRPQGGLEGRRDRPAPGRRLRHGQAHGDERRREPRQADHLPDRHLAAGVTEGPLGAALCRAYNNWAHDLVKGNEEHCCPSR